MAMVLAGYKSSWLPAVPLPQPWHHPGGYFSLEVLPKLFLPSFLPGVRKKYPKYSFVSKHPTKKNPKLMQLPTWEWIALNYKCNPLDIRCHKTISPPFNPFMTKLLQNTQNTALCKAAAYFGLLFSSTVCGGAALGWSCSPGKDNLLCPAHALEWRGHGAALPQMSRVLCAFSRDTPGLQGRRKWFLKFMNNKRCLYPELGTDMVLAGPSQVPLRFIRAFVTT